MNHTKQLTQNKYLEIELDIYTIKEICNWFNFHIEWTTHTDHAGFRFELDLFGLSVNIMIYDIRHWDYKNNKYEENKNDNTR